MDNVLDLTNLNTQNVTNMDAMFKDCNNINEADISTLDMSNVTDASNMFSGCSNLTKLTMTGVDTSNISNSTQFFDGCDNLKTIVVDSQTDLSGINSQILTNTNVRNIDEYFTEDERLLLKGSERITRELKVQGNIFGDSNHKAFLPNIKSDSIELGDGVVRKIDKDAKSGVVSYDATNEKFVTSNAVAKKYKFFRASAMQVITREPAAGDTFIWLLGEDYLAFAAYTNNQWYTNVSVGRATITINENTLVIQTTPERALCAIIAEGEVK